MKVAGGRCDRCVEFEVAEAVQPVGFDAESFHIDPVAIGLHAEMGERAEDRPEEKSGLPVATGNPHARRR